MDAQNLIISIGGKKLDLIDPNSLPPEAAALLSMMNQKVTPSTSINLPPEAAALLNQMQSPKASPSLPPEAAALLNQMQNPTKIKVSETSPDLKPIVEQVKRDQAQQEAQQASDNGSLVRSVPEEVQKALDRQRALNEINRVTELRQKMVIFESGVALNIVLGTTTKAEVEKLMHNFSKVQKTNDGNDFMAFYSDITLTIFYNEDFIVREMVFGNKYKSPTKKGLFVGDTVQKAIELYGQPRMKTMKGAIWNKFGVFCDGQIINAIRIQS